MIPNKKRRVKRTEMLKSLAAKQLKGTASKALTTGNVELDSLPDRGLYRNYGNASITPQKRNELPRRERRDSPVQPKRIKVVTDVTDDTKDITISLSTTFKMLFLGRMINEDIKKSNLKSKSEIALYVQFSKLGEKAKRSELEQLKAKARQERSLKR